jgi:hypothetical protein
MMTFMMNVERNAFIAIAWVAIALLPNMGFAKSRPITMMDLVEALHPGEPWNRGVFALTKMVTFQQEANTSGGADATHVAKITLSYFTSANCSAASGISVPTYATPDGTSFAITVGAPFGMVAASVWNVGSSEVFPVVADMTTIQSIAVTLKSTNSNTPQASMAGNSFACVPVLCSSGECRSTSGSQSFQLKTTVALGDPVDGGLIACMDGGLNNFIVSTHDNGQNSLWGGFGTLTGANSTIDGAANTAMIVEALGTSTTYAAKTCQLISIGAHTSGWFLPARDQLNCIYSHHAMISNFSGSSYSSSTEFDATFFWAQDFRQGEMFVDHKNNTFDLRCVRSFTQ